MLTTAARTRYDALSFDAKQQAAAIASDALLTGIQRRQSRIAILIRRNVFLLNFPAGSAGHLLQLMVGQFGGLVLLFEVRHS